MTRALATAFALMLASTASAQEAAVTHTVTDNYDNVAFAVESAILGAGLVIDHVSHVGDMLERTRADVGSDKVLYTKADVFSFCSATVSRAVMEADITNLQHCPYGIFVYETPDNPGQITVGHRAYSGSMAPVQEFLDAIVSEALGLE